jgi:hypothetical protein
MQARTIDQHVLLLLLLQVQAELEAIKLKAT